MQGRPDGILCVPKGLRKILNQIADVKRVRFGMHFDPRPHTRLAWPAAL